jgi:RNB domain
MTLSTFPPQSIAQAKAVTFADTLWQRPQVIGITIDGPTSRDLDDAIWIESTPTGAIVSVHIADVAEFVTPGTLLDKVAIARTRRDIKKNQSSINWISFLLKIEKNDRSYGKPTACPKCSLWTHSLP